MQSGSSVGNHRSQPALASNERAVFQNQDGLKQSDLIDAINFPHLDSRYGAMPKSARTANTYSDNLC
jgi:hypothetical protein